MMLGVDRLANLERQGKASPVTGTDMRNPIRHPGRRGHWAIPANEAGNKVRSAFATRTLAGLGWVDDSVSRPDILAAVRAAAGAVGWSVDCTETKSTFPRTQYNRQCAVVGRPDLVFSADLIFDHAGGPNAGIQLALANSQDQGTGYTPPPAVIQAPELFQYASPKVTTAAPTKSSPPPAAAAAPASTNPAPQNQPAPTTQPGVVGAGAGAQAGGQTQTEDTTGEWIPGVSNTVLLIAAAAVVGLVMMKR